AVFRSYAWIIEAGRNGMYCGRLAVRILKDVAERAVQNTWLPVAEGGCVISRFRAAAARLHTDQLYRLIADERIKHAGGVAAAATAGHHNIRQAAHLFQALLTSFLADDRLEIAHHGRKRMRPNDAADDVMRVLHRGHPVTHGFVDGVAESSAAAFHRDHFRPK